MNNTIVHHSTHKRKEGLTAYVVVILLGLLALGPIVILVFNSFKSNLEIGENSVGLPEKLRWGNYPQAWEQGDFGVTVPNSLYYVIVTVTVVLLLGGMAAYSLARLKPRGADFYITSMVGLSTVPIWLYVVPLFVLLRRFGLVNNRWGFVILNIALNAPFAILLLRSYMLEVPSDFEDAARVDGANEWQILIEIVLPIVWPAFLTVGLVTALAVWNEFQVAFIFLHSPELQPVATGYYAFRRRFSTDWSLTSAAAVMMIAPVIGIFLIMQRRFVEGLAQGGLKG